MQPIDQRRTEMQERTNELLILLRVLAFATSQQLAMQSNSMMEGWTLPSKGVSRCIPEYHSAKKIGMPSTAAKRMLL